MKHFYKVVSLFSIALLLLSPSIAIASSKSNDTSKKVYTESELEVRFEQIHSIMRQVYEKKVTKDVAFKKLAKMNVYPVNEASIESSSNDSGIGSLSNPDTQITLYPPFVLKDVDTGFWYAGTNFYWENEGWKLDFPSPWPEDPGIGVEIGGYDGFGLAFDRPITVRSSRLDVYSNYNTLTQYNYETKKTNYGVVYQKQDFGYLLSGGYSYNWDNASIGLWFTPQELGEQYGVWGEVSHTWSTTSGSVTGISWIGISWDYSSENYKWDIASGSELFTPY